MKSNNKILFTLLILVYSYTCTACSCVPLIFDSEIKRTDLIASGIILNKKVVTFEEDFNSSDEKKLVDSLNNRCGPLMQQLGAIEVIVKITRLLKGKVSNDIVKVFTQPNEASCGYGKFEIGTEFIIFASIPKCSINPKDEANKTIENKHQYWTGLCTSTSKFNNKLFEQTRQTLNEEFNSNAFSIFIESLINKNLIVSNSKLNVNFISFELRKNIGNKLTIKNKNINIYSESYNAFSQRYSLNIKHLEIDNISYIGRDLIKVSFKSYWENDEEYYGSVVLKLFDQKYYFQDLKYYSLKE